MSYKYVVLGAGRQGVAIAYDLAKFCEANSIVLADKDLKIAQRGTERIGSLLQTSIATAKTADAADPRELTKLFLGANSVISAVPYYFNLELAKSAIEAKANFCDLGGNTGIVLRELKLDKEAKKAGVTVVPDTGLMPGLGNTLAVYAINKLETTDEIHIYCGGLPQNPRPPLNYKLVFSIEGLLNEYFGTAYVLRYGKVKEIPTFSELEEIEFDPPVGKCEAFVTSGGTSTCPWTFEGKIKEYDYKTVRYPGHYDKIKALLDLGFLDSKPLKVKDAEIKPRDFTCILLSQNINFPEDHDLVVLRIVARGMFKSRAVEIKMNIIDYHDENTGFSAMERTTGFPAAIVAYHLAQGLAPKGAVPLEKAIEPMRFLEDFKKRGIFFKEEMNQVLI
ncbi:MAG: saccharopine dehydrogenase C-terminal domain-containing protein [Candidatus Edwardsbacteria bacterium]